MAKETEIDKLTIAIVTTVYNAVNTIEETIKSVVNQTYDNIEYIVIDGCSDDGTSDIIKKYDQYIDYWTSEPDNGIYDGMNKGIKQSTGEIIYFLNADDKLYDEKVIEDVAKYFNNNKNLKILSGRVTIIDDKYNLISKTKKRISGNIIKRALSLCHQSIFMKREILIKNGMFDTRYKIISDFDLFCKVLLQRYEIKYINRYISLYKRWGAAGSDIKLSIIEHSRIIREYFGYLPYIDYLTKEIIKLIIRQFISTVGLLSHYYKLKSIIRNKFN